MARTDFTTPRLCLDDDLALGRTLALAQQAANYLVNVLRLKSGARVLAFNGRDGEFAAALGAEKKRATLTLTQKLREQEPPPPVDYLFAPLKHARLDYMAQKAVAPQPLGEALAQWPAERLLVFCDEDAAVANPLDALRAAPDAAGVGLLIGPEGGFTDEERGEIGRLPNVLRLSLGPRILRADTAAVAALALIQARFGDWR